MKGIKPRKMNTASNKRSAGWLRGALMSALLLVSVVLIVVMIRFYYAELDNQLFAERSSHLLEITEKVADIYDITIARSWDSLNILEQFLSMEGAQTEEELIQLLKDMSRYRASEGNIFAAGQQLPLLCLQRQHRLLERASRDHRQPEPDAGIDHDAALPEQLLYLSLFFEAAAWTGFPSTPSEAQAIRTL